MLTMGRRKILGSLAFALSGSIPLVDRLMNLKGYRTQTIIRSADGDLSLFNSRSDNISDYLKDTDPIYWSRFFKVKNSYIRSNKLVIGVRKNSPEKIVIYNVWKSKQDYLNFVSAVDMNRLNSELSKNNYSIQTKPC